MIEDDVVSQRRRIPRVDTRATQTVDVFLADGIGVDVDDDVEVVRVVGFSS
jgi:hypothetical protein